MLSPYNIGIAKSYEFRLIGRLFFFVQISLIALLIFLPHPIWSILALISILTLPFFIFSPGNLLLLITTYISVFPNQNWGSKYDIFVHYVDIRIVIAMFLLLSIILFIKMINERVWQFKFLFFDKLFFAFFVYSILNYIWGLANNGNLKLASIELYFIMLYSSFFFCRFILTDFSWVNKFYYILIFSTTIASIQYIILTIQNLDISNIFINRVTTQQPHLAQITVPLLVAGLIYSKSIVAKLINILLLMLHLSMVLFSQQRGLWVGVLLSIFIVLFLYYFREGFKAAKILQFTLGVFSALIVTVILLVVAQKYFNIEVILTVLQRLDTLKDVSGDESWKIRFTEVKFALENWKNTPIFGCGLGATFPTTYSFRDNIGLDNSYAFILWKLGIIGISIFTTIYLIFLVIGFKSYWSSKDNSDRILISGFVAGITGMMLIAFTNMSIIYYRFNIIWGILIAIIYTISLNLKNQR